MHVHQTLLVLVVVVASIVVTVAQAAFVSNTPTSLATSSFALSVFKFKSTTVGSRCTSCRGTRLYSSNAFGAQPAPPDLKRAALPAMLVGGLFLFASSVPSSQREFADQLLSLSETALRSDPTVAMELGMGVESGGIYASSHASGKVTYGGSRAAVAVEQLVVQFQINGGNAWAQGIAYGIRENVVSADGDVTLLTLEVANMDAVLNDQSFVVPLKLFDEPEHDGER